MKKITITLAILLLLSIGGNVFLCIKKADISNELKTAQEGKDESSSELDNIQNEKSELSAKLEEIEKEKEELSSKLEKVKKEKDELSSKLQSAEKGKKEIEDKLNSANKDYKELKKQYDELLEKYNKECVPEIEQPENLDDYAKNISYKDLSRTPDKFEGKAICYTGEVVQLVEGDGVNALRVAINGDYGNMFYLEYKPEIISERVLENDTITFYGIYYGIYQYESTFGTTISIPAATVDHIKIK